MGLGNEKQEVSESVRKQVSAYSERSVREFLRQTKHELEASDHYNSKAQAYEFEAEAADDAGFYFISYAWEPPAQADARRGADTFVCRVVIAVKLLGSGYCSHRSKLVWDVVHANESHAS